MSARKSQHDESNSIHIIVGTPELIRISANQLISEGFVSRFVSNHAGKIDCMILQRGDKLAVVSLPGHGWTSS